MNGRRRAVLGQLEGRSGHDHDDQEDGGKPKVVAVEEHLATEGEKRRRIGSARRQGRVRVGLQVLAQQVAPEIPVEIAPHRVDMVGVVLRLIELHEKRRPL